MAKKARNYKKEYAEYHATEEQKKRRAERNKDRRAAERSGKVSKGDNKEVDHVNAPRKGSLAKSSTRIVSKKTNRKKQPKRS
jgi:hypothetical protein